MSYIGKKFILKKQISYLLILCFIFSNLLTGMSSIHAAPNPQISKTSRDILVGKKYNLNINGKVKNSTYKWKSSNTSVATVNERGFVTGIKKGKAVITCTVTTPKKVYELTSKVTIRKPATSIIINNKIEEITVGERYNLNKTIRPASSNDTTTWITSDETIAKPDKNGIFTALKAGEVTITAKTLSGKTDEVTILVKPKEATNTLTPSPTEVPSTPMPTKVPSIPIPTPTPNTPAPTQTPGTPAPTKPTSRILSEADIVEGVIEIVNETYDIVTISSSVGDAEIIFDNVTIKGKLELAQGAGYTVRIRKSSINDIIALEEMAVRTFSLFSFSAKAVESPALIAEEGTVVIAIDIRGNISVKQEGKAEIGVVKVSKTTMGNIDVKLEGFSGNLVVNTSSFTDIAITTANCNIQEATINGSDNGQVLSITDNTLSGKESSIGRVQVNSSAALKLDISAKDLVIASTSKDASITIEKSIENVLSEGKAINLNIKSSIENVISKGEALTMTVSTGSSVKSIEATGDSTRIEVALGSTIHSIISKGDASEIKGNGTVTEVLVEGNDTKVDTSNTTITVKEDVSGTTAGGKEIESGTTITPTPKPTEPPATPTPDIPETGTVITIEDPGEVWVGSEVSMEADLDEVTWEVYTEIDGTYGHATMDPETGVLTVGHKGIIRVVARSKYNTEVYGAVDITIQNKKFIGYEPLERVIIDSDEGIIGLQALRGSGKLPETVNFIYETGNGSEVEIVTANLSFKRAWWNGYIGGYNGGYNGAEVGTYLLGYYIDGEIPEGYDNPPGELHVYTTVEVRVPQSDIRYGVTSINPLEPIYITEDENLMSSYQVYNQYLENKDIEITLSNGANAILKVNGFDGATYDGTTPGIYSINARIDLPGNMVYREETFSGNSVFLSDREYLIVPIQINLEKAQSRVAVIVPEEKEIPQTTQPKFTAIREEAVIRSVTITVLPEELRAGDSIDLNHYIRVDTNSNKVRDYMVQWAVNGSHLGNAHSLIMVREGVQIIKATSVIDNTKYDEVIITIEAEPKSNISQFNQFVDIYVLEEVEIHDFRTLYEELKDQLPNHLTGITQEGESINFPITGWDMNAIEGENFILAPKIDTFQIGYNISNLPELTIVLSNQRDTRIPVSVVTGTAIVINTLTYDKYATREWGLQEYIRTQSNITIPVILEDGSSQFLECISSEITLSGNVYYKDTGYKYNGEAGVVQLEAVVSLPKGYKDADGSNIVTVSLELYVMVSQTPRYEGIWVTEKPTKLFYTIGDTLDLSGITVALYNRLIGEDTYIGKEKLDDYEINIRIQTAYGSVYSKEEPFTLEMNNAYVYVGKDNMGEAFFGPIAVTE